MLQMILGHLLKNISILQNKNKNVSRETLSHMFHVKHSFFITYLAIISIGFEKAVNVV